MIESKLLALDLAAPVEPEPRRPVLCPRRPFSASSINAYMECPRKWFYRYVCRAVEDPGSTAAAYGTAFHLALERLHHDFAHPDPKDEVRMRTELDAHVDRVFGESGEEFPSAVERELLRRRAQRTAVRYLDWLIERARRTPFTVIGCELPAPLELDGFRFTGFIDRIDREDASGDVAILDYKTGNIATDAQAYRAKMRAFKDFQLPFYYLARTAAGDRVTRLALIPLKDPLLAVSPVEILIDPEVLREIEAARARLLEICATLTGDAVEEFAVTSDSQACTYCAYRLACTDRPGAPEERFGR